MPGASGSSAGGASSSAPSGSSEVKLSSIADIQTTASLSEINHDNQKRSLSVTASVKDGYNITHVNSDVQKMIKKELLNMHLLPVTRKMVLKLQSGTK